MGEQMTDRHPLNDFADRWELDGDYIRCRTCTRPQIVSLMHHDFHHAAGCRLASSEQKPWKTLIALLWAEGIEAKWP